MSLKTRKADWVNPDQLVPPELPMLCRVVPKEARLWCEPEFLVEEGIAANKILETAAEKNASWRASPL